MTDHVYKTSSFCKWILVCNKHMHLTLFMFVDADNWTYWFGSMLNLCCFNSLQVQTNTYHGRKAWNNAPSKSWRAATVTWTEVQPEDSNPILLELWPALVFTSLLIYVNRLIRKGLKNDWTNKSRLRNSTTCNTTHVQKWQQTLFDLFLSLLIHQYGLDSTWITDIVMHHCFTAITNDMVHSNCLKDLWIKIII